MSDYTSSTGEAAVSVNVASIFNTGATKRFFVMTAPGCGQRSVSAGQLVRQGIDRDGRLVSRYAATDT